MSDPIDEQVQEARDLYGHADGTPHDIDPATGCCRHCVYGMPKEKRDE